MSNPVLRLLIVDDEESVREPLAERLTHFYGYEVGTAANGQEALRLLAGPQGRRDVVLVDQILIGKISGVDLLREIKSRYPDTQIIMFTGWEKEMEKEGVNILRLGAYRYFKKPYDFDELALTIQFAAEEKQIRLERQYLAALVKVGQGLTATTQETEQLNLAWNFVREQLDVSTFFVGLPSSDGKCIHFPLAYDQGQQINLLDTILMSGKSRDWGLAEYVIRTGEEILWPTLDEMKKVCKARKITPIIINEPSASGFCFPLQVGDRVCGVLSAQSTRSYIFTASLQNALRSLGSQLSVAMENNRLFAEAERTTVEIEHKANSLSALQGLILTINSSLNLDEILTKACQLAVEFFIADHSGLVLFEGDHKQGIVEAEYPNFNVRGQKIPLLGVPAEENLIETQQPLEVYDVDSEVSLGEVRNILNKLKIQSILFMPVIGKRGLLGTFSLDSIKQKRHFVDEEIALCKTFADQVAVAIENAQLFKAESRRRQETETLREAALAITTSLEPQEIFERILSELQKVVPYDSASVQLLKGDQLVIIGGRGFPNLVELLGCSFPLEGNNPNHEVILRKAPFIVPDAPAVYKGFMQTPHKQAGIRGWLGVPMQVGDRLIGMIAIDKQNPNYYTDEHAQLAQVFASQAAIAIENARLYQDVREGQEYLQSLFNASSKIISAQDPETVLQLVVNIACKATVAWRAVALLINQDLQKTTRILAEVGFDSTLVPPVEIRLDGYSVHVIKTGEPCFIRDNRAPDLPIPINPHTVERGTRAAACLPLTVRNENMGVLWIEFREVHDFSKTEKQALRLYATQAAIAYENARRMRELEHMRRAAEAMAGALVPSQVLQQIVESASEVLQADSSTIWSYDNVRNQFIPEELAAFGVTTKELERFRKNEPKKSGTARTVMEQGWVGVTDISDKKYNFMGSSTLELLKSIGAKSFQGVALKVSNEELGVLYANYNRPRSFTGEDRRILETFAYHAALALKKGRLLEQVGKARDVAKVVAQVSVLEELRHTLNSIVIGTQDALRCDVVTLYTYDQEREEFSFPPAMVGVEKKTGVLELGHVAAQSVVRNILALENAHEAEDARSDPLMRGPFVFRENIKSSVGIPLRVGDRKVGVMFVNYRSPHRFTSDESTNIELFANQAAVAIRNAQLYQAEQRYAEALHAIQATSSAVSAVLELNVLLPMITNEAAKIFNAPATSLMLWDETKKNLVIRAAFGLSDEYKQSQRISGNVVNKIVAEKNLEPQVFDIRHEPIGDPKHVISEELHNVLVAPLKIGTELIGILNVYSKDGPRRFEEKEKGLASIFANHATIAIQNAQQYEELKKTKGLVGTRTALAWMGMVSSTWRHAITRDAVTIREQTILLRGDLAGSSLSEAINKRLAMIERLTSRILEKPITAPLSTKEGAVSISLNKLIQERLNSLWNHDLYKSVKLDLNFMLEASATVHVNPEWVQRVIDILVDNAVDVMQGLPKPQLTVSTSRLGNQAEILFRDNGHGIPVELQEYLFREPIHKSQDEKGQGMGLLFAQTIVQTYGGEIRVKDTGAKGTIMAVSFPLEILAE